MKRKHLLYLINYKKKSQQSVFETITIYYLLKIHENSNSKVRIT